MANTNKLQVFGVPVLATIRHIKSAAPQLQNPQGRSRGDKHVAVQFLRLRRRRAQGQFSMSWQATAWAERQKTGSSSRKALLLVLT